MSDLKALRQQQAFLQNCALVISFLAVYVQNSYILKFSLLEFTPVFWWWSALLVCMDKRPTKTTSVPLRASPEKR